MKFLPDPKHKVKRSGRLGLTQLILGIFKLRHYPVFMFLSSQNEALSYSLNLAQNPAIHVVARAKTSSEVAVEIRI